jgi:hypothetical protein
MDSRLRWNDINRVGCRAILQKNPRLTAGANKKPPLNSEGWFL